MLRLGLACAKGRFNYKCEIEYSLFLLLIFLLCLALKRESKKSIKQRKQSSGNGPKCSFSKAVKQCH